MAGARFETALEGGRTEAILAHLRAILALLEKDCFWAANIPAICWGTGGAGRLGRRRARTTWRSCDLCYAKRELCHRDFTYAQYTARRQKHGVFVVYFFVVFQLVATTALLVSHLTVVVKNQLARGRR